VSIRVLVIRTTEEPFLTRIAGPRTPSTLDALQAEVGGYIEPITGSDWVMYLDEDGKMKNLNPNPTASRLAHRLGWQGLRAGDFIVGTVVVCGRNGPEESDVPQHVLDTLEGLSK